MLDELISLVVLHALPGMGPLTLRRLTARFGSAADVMEQQKADAFADVKGITAQLIQSILQARRNLPWAERTVAALQNRGVRIVRNDSLAYPAALNDLTNPPSLLYMIGAITPEDLRSVSVVGTTKPSARGRPITERFAAKFARAGITVVSGCAHGIDAAAHRGAFNAGGRSILCVPYGIQRFKSRPDFPPLAEISRRGAVISECPPDREWSAAAAVARDRIVAALGRALLVVETRTKGGTWHTVGAAEALHRPVFALKYRSAPPSARGNAILIARGAAALHTFAETEQVIRAASGNAAADSPADRQQDLS